MIFAQVENIAQGLGGNGPAWTLVGLLLTLVWFLLRMLLAEKDKRIDDAVKNRDETATSLKDIAESMSHIDRKIRISKEQHS